MVDSGDVEIRICKHCWIEAIEPPAGKRTVGKGTIPEFQHKAVRDDVGNAYCGRQFLTEDDIEFVTRTSE